MTGAVASGGCLCGAVRFTCTGAMISARACWCRLCQYIGAGSATVNALFPSDGFHLTGETRDFVSVADSGSVMHRHFCPACGTHLSERRRAGRMSSSCVSARWTIPTPAAPGSTIWTAEAPRWAAIDPHLPMLPGQPPPPPGPLT